MRIAIILFLLFINGILSAQVKFDMPLKGTPGKDFYIVNYVDHDTSKGLQDPFCGDKTYDGHQGTDMVLRSWKQADSGVEVYAVADGYVYKTNDGMFDRNKHGNNLGLGNYIAINHNNEVYSYYGHLRNGSIKVKYGDFVSAGQMIGYVACSGNCTDPHLHLEVYDNYGLRDPFEGKCQSTATLWNSQPLYDTSTKLIETGFVPYLPNLDTLRERYLVKDTFDINDTIVCFWALMQGLKKGDSSRVDWYTPSGQFWYSYAYQHSSDLWYAYTWTYINRPPVNIPGKWTAKYYVKGKLITSQIFYFSALNGITNNEKQAEDIRIFPNPATNEITIENAPREAFQYKIINPEGKILQAGTLNSNKLSISGLKPGVYYLSIKGVMTLLIRQ